MIDVRELRIGNYVHLFESDTPYRITEIGYSEIEDDRYEASGISSESVFRTYIENLNPISITEELLLKCGFKHEAFYKAYYTEDLGYIVFKEDGVYLYDSENCYICMSKAITSLHQLQNLYFFLTGKELEVYL